MWIKLLISLALFAPAELFGQTQIPPPVSKAMRQTAGAELEAVIADAGKLDDKLAIVNVRARAAALVSLSDPVRSEIMFLEIWRFVKAQTDKDFDKEQAQTLILRYLFPRNPKLAKQLMSELSKAEGSSLESRATGHDPGLSRGAKLASQLVDEDPRVASEILERSLSGGMTYAGLNALLRLREKDALLSDLVVAKTVDGLRFQPDIVSLSGLQLLSAYLFPDGSVAASSDSLVLHYFSSTYEVLRSSLAQSEAAMAKSQHYTQGDLRFRAANQARVAITLAALAPRYGPALAAELAALANKLESQLPDNVVQLAKLTAARLAGNQADSDNPELGISFAISNGDFVEASRLIDGLASDELRKTYSQLLAKLESKSLLVSGDVMGALTRIRKVEDQSARLVLYLEALKACQKKKDAVLSGAVISEARSLIPQADRNGLHVRALIAFASQLPALASKGEALDFLDAAVVAINSLPKRSGETGETKSSTELAWSEINDPFTLLELPDFSNAFSSLGVVDLDGTLIEARKIEVRSVQLVARLAAVEGVMRIDARRLRPKPAGKTLTRSGH